MPEYPSEQACEEFQDQLAEQFATGVNSSEHPHAKTCERCCALMRDLYRMAENSRHFRFGVDECINDDWSEST